MNHRLERGIGLPRLVAVLGIFLVLPVASTGCKGENTPEYWAKRIQKPAYREQAIKRLGEIYLDRVKAANGDTSDPEVQHAVDVMVPALIDTFNKYKTDNASRSAISTLLAQIGDERAIPVFEELLDYQKGINETDASKAAEALGKLGSEDSIPKIIAMMDAIKADRGVDGRNRPEDDWMTRSAVTALRDILNAHPDTTHRDAAIQALNDALETTADQQDFFINKIAAKALGDIADEDSIPILIRGLFFQGRGATVYQQCRVALCKVAIQHRDQVIDKLFEGYKGEFEELEKDAERFEFFHGIKQNKIGLMFYELRIDPEEDKEIYAYLMERVQDEEVDKEGVLQGMASETLAMLGYPGIIEYVVEFTDERDWMEDTYDYKVFASFMSGIIGTQSLKMPMSFDKRLVDIAFMVMEEMEGDANAPFRVSAGLLASVIARPEHEEEFEALTEAEENEEVKEQFEGFMERFKVRSECRQDQGCWLDKLQVSDEQWRVKQLAVLWLGFNAEPNDVQTIDAISALFNQGKDAEGKLLGSRNQDVLKAVIISLDLLQPDGCKGKTCERLAKVIPYFRKKPQYGVIANSGECLWARLLGRQGGSVQQMHDTGDDTGDE